MMELLWVTEEINKKSVARKDSPAAKHIRRPENAFMIFRKRKIRPFHKELHASEISRLAKEQWWQLSDEEQKYYARESEIEKLKHSVSYPNWKYSPKPSRKKKSSVLTPKEKPLQKSLTPAANKPPVRLNQIEATPENQLEKNTSETAKKTSCQSLVYSNQHIQHFDDFLSNSSNLLIDNSNLNSTAPHPTEAHPIFSQVSTESGISNFSLAPTAVFDEYHMDCGNSSMEELIAKEFSMFFTGDNLNGLFLFNNKQV
uniref:HMG protein n=1 Tax=Mucor circinelloides TaxID=36080 RepID=E5FJW4_MUCCI|nr:HMG protein [Mucor circinelloides]